MRTLVAALPASNLSLFNGMNSAATQNIVLTASAIFKPISFKMLIITCLMFGGQMSPAQAETSNKTLTLDTALKLVMEQNPSLKIFDFRNTALTGQMKTANLRPAYELAVDAENFSGADKINDFDRTELTVSLSSILEMGNKRTARRGVVSNSRLFLDARKQVASLALLGEATRRYVEVLTAQEQVFLAKEANELANQALAIVTKRADAGAASDAEVKRAQAAAAQAKLTQLSIQQQLKYLKVALSALWGETPPYFSRVNGDLFRFGRDVKLTTLYAKLEKNPAIQVFAAEERLKEAEVRLAKTQSKADLNWSVGIRRFQESNDSALVAGFSMPLFSSRRNSGAITTALARRNEVFVKKDVALLNIYTQLFRAFHNRKQAIHAANELQSSIIPALEEALKITQAAYQQGRYSYLEYVSARQELLNARRTLIESASSALTYGAEIEQLTAEPLPAAQYGESTDASGSEQ